MKYLQTTISNLFSFLIISSSLSGEDFYSKISERVQKLFSEREIPLLLPIGNPFFKETETIIKNDILPISKQEENLILEMIFNDKAKISGKWYFQNDLCKKYRVVEIGSDFVRLSKENGEKILKIGKKNRFNFKTKVEK
jgi:hypothetical protein